jgi:LPS-assembly lipoprotein
MTLFKRISALPIKSVTLALGLGLSLGLTLAACGFQPLYKAEGGAKQAASVQRMAAIDIPPIGNRSGQILRNELRDQLLPRGRVARPLYRLDVSLTETQADVGILRDATATFSRYTADVNWVLTDLETDAPILRGNNRRITSFPIAASEFSSLEAEKDARDRALAQLAGDVRLRLVLFFERGS